MTVKDKEQTVDLRLADVVRLVATLTGKRIPPEATAEIINERLVIRWVK